MDIKAFDAPLMHKQCTSAMALSLLRPRRLLVMFLHLVLYDSKFRKYVASPLEGTIRYPKTHSLYLSDAVVSRIAFGSCSNQSAPQPIWNAIIDFDPQLFIWLGDNIYGDNRRPLRIFGREATIGPWKNTPRFFPSDESEMRRRYQVAKAQPGYSQLRKRAQVIGTWDDHDYGLNDAGKEFSGKNTSQRLLLDFLDEPEESPRRRQAGVYASYVFGPRGKQVKVILLDTRYHRDPLFSDGTILGESQWKWLEKELYGPSSEITIIASSIQVVSNLSANTGPFFYVESWGHFPKERERLYKLISDTERSGVFFISGDVHFAEIARYDCGCQYPLYDITSSGLTQAVERTVPPPLDYLLRLAAWLTPTTMRVYSPTCQYKSCTYGIALVYLPTYHAASHCSSARRSERPYKIHKFRVLSKQNFGAIEIDWNAVPHSIKFEIRSVSGDSVNMVKIPLTELQPKKTNGSHTEETHRQHCVLEVELPWFLRHQLAFVFFGSLAVYCVALILFVRIIASAGKSFVQKLKVD